MRIIAGRLRHRKLLTSPGTVTRPITDRVKEALFQRLTLDLPGRRTADIFAGTGTLGLEALSRGAYSVVFIEQDRQACRLLRENIERLGIEAETVCWQTDALRSSYRPQGCPDFVPFDLIFFDPPYRYVTGQQHHLLRSCLVRLARESVSSTEALLMVRTPEHAQFPLPLPWQQAWELVRSGMRIQVASKTLRQQARSLNEMIEMPAPDRSSQDDQEELEQTPPALADDA